MEYYKICIFVFIAVVLALLSWGVARLVKEEYTYSSDESYDPDKAAQELTSKWLEEDDPYEDYEGEPSEFIKEILSLYEKEVNKCTERGDLSIGGVTLNINDKTKVFIEDVWGKPLTMRIRTPKYSGRYELNNLELDLFKQCKDKHKKVIRKLRDEEETLRRKELEDSVLREIKESLNEQ